MIFSMVENVNEHDKAQKIRIKGKAEEIALELENVMKELLQRGFPEELILSAVYEAINNIEHLA